MKKNNYRYKIIYFIILLVGFMFQGCENNEELSNEIDQLFRPRSFSSQVFGVDVTLSWVPIKDATYVLEISKDSLLFTNELQQIEIGNVRTYKLTDLDGLSQYSARIKSVMKDSTIKDSGYNVLTFKTETENIFYTIKDENIGSNSVLLKWDKERAVTHIVVSVGGVDDETVSLSEAEIADGQKLIEGLDLAHAVPYAFKIFNNDRQRGILTLSKTVTVEVDMTLTGGWHDLGDFYFLKDAGAFTRIKNDGTTKHVIADAFKFTKGDYEIIVDNDDPGVTIEGTWATSSSSATRIGENYLHDQNKLKGEKSITYMPELPESGYWTVSIFFYGGSVWADNAPIDIYAGDL